MWLAEAHTTGPFSAPFCSDHSGCPYIQIAWAPRHIRSELSISYCNLFLSPKKVYLEKHNACVIFDYDLRNDYESRGNFRTVARNQGVTGYENIIYGSHLSTLMDARLTLYINLSAFFDNTSTDQSFFTYCNLSTSQINIYLQGHIA